MARRQGREQPVSEAEYDSMPERVCQHFSRIRGLLATELDDDAPGDDEETNDG